MEITSAYIHAPSIRAKFNKLPKITTSGDVFELLPKIYGESAYHVESMYCLALNRNNAVIGYKKISTGGIAGTVADPKVVFQFALTSNASGIILTHNHPSGNTSPSKQDISITKKLQDAGRFLEIPVLDHIIYTTSEKYYSMADNGDM